MKKLLVALVLSAAGVLASFGKTTSDYVQDGLIACWDGYENDGAGGHATSLTEWKDTSGNHSFVFNASSGITVDGNALVFPGTQAGYATLDATSTAATFEAAKNGTVEIVIISDPTTVQNVALQAPAAAGIAVGALSRTKSTAVATVVMHSGSSSKPAVSYNWSVGTNTFSTTYSSAIPSTILVNGASATAASNWFSPKSGESKTYLGHRQALTSGQAFKGRIFAIRLYSTKLSAEDIAANREVDVERFVNGNAELVDGVFVSGAPAKYQEGGVPAYGYTPAIPGDPVELTAPAAVSLGDGRRAYCLGWKRYDRATGTLIAESDADTRLSCSFTYSSPVKVVWQWEEQILVGTSAAAGLTVSPVSVWAKAGDSVSLAVSGTDHPIWSGDAVFSNRSQTNITVTVTAPTTVSVAEDRVFYVTPEGAGLRDGSAWSEAMGSLQDALDAAYAANEPCTIKMKAGLYTTTTQTTCTNTQLLAIRGGYAGEGDTLSDKTTIIARDTSATYKGRVMKAAGATLTMERITLANGRIGTAEKAESKSTYGLCLYANNTALTMTDCVVSNGYHYTSIAYGYYYGGGVASVGGSLMLDGCLFYKNSIGAPNDNNSSFGGGLYVSGGTGVTVRETTFDSNLVNVYYISCKGGAACLSAVPKAVFTDCFFTNNWIKKSEGYSGRDNGYGGAICIEAGNTITATTCFTNCIFIANGNNSRISSTYGLRGGTLFASGSKQTTTISKCVFFGNGRRVRGAKVSALYDSGSIYLSSGTMYLENVLQANCEYGDALEAAGGTLTAVNCTFADMEHGYGYRQTGKATTSFRGCVFGGVSNGLYLVSSGSAPTYAYCAADSDISGTACFQTDDLRFADRRYYHLQSRAGAYAGGWFANGAFQVTAVTSPALDLGAEEDAWANEPQPNYHRANIGYDANTDVASKSDFVSDPVVDPAKVQVFAYPVADIGESSANARCEVASAAGEATADVTIVWDSADRGTSAVGDWAHSQSLGALAPWALTSYLIDGLSGTTVYRFYANNGSLSGWSDARTVVLATKATVELTSVFRITRHTASVAGTLVDNGGTETTVKLVVSRKDGTGTPLEFLYDLGNPVPSGTALAFDVTGLDADTDYVFSIVATNSAGDAKAEEEHKTVSTAPIVRYVTPTGAGLKDGSNWANAYQLQAAFKECTYAGDEIRMLKGTYLEFGYNNADDKSASLLTGAAGLTVRGGYTGSGDQRGDEATILDRVKTLLPTPYRRHINISSSTVRFEDLVFTNGLVTVSGQVGMSVKAASSAVSFKNCVFAKNGCDDGSGSFYGGAIYTSGGSLSVTDCAFNGNRVRCPNDNCEASGGAIYTSGTAVEIRDSVFSANFVHSHYKYHAGGAISLNGAGNAMISNCTFVGNCTRRVDESGTVRNFGRGGAVYFAPGNNVARRLEIVDTTIDGSYVRANGGRGGVLFVDGNKQVTVLNRVAIIRSGISGTTLPQYNHGDIDIAAGTLAMTNVLFAANTASNLVRVAGGNFQAVNCTFADSQQGYGLVVTANVTPTLHNTIVWGNAAGAIGGAYAANLTATYCDLQGATVWTGEGNINADPRFKGDYTLRGSSPCIDAGLKADWMDGATDLNGNPRLRQISVDLGCSECDKHGLAILVK